MKSLVPYILSNFESWSIEELLYYYINGVNLIDKETSAYMNIQRGAVRQEEKNWCNEVGLICSPSACGSGNELTTWECCVAGPDLFRSSVGCG